MANVLNAVPASSYTTEAVSASHRGAHVSLIACPTCFRNGPANCPATIEHNHRDTASLFSRPMRQADAQSTTALENIKQQLREA